MFPEKKISRIVRKWDQGEMEPDKPKVSSQVPQCLTVAQSGRKLWSHYRKHLIVAWITGRELEYLDAQV